MGSWDAFRAVDPQDGRSRITVSERILPSEAVDVTQRDHGGVAIYPCGVQQFRRVESFRDNPARGGKRGPVSLFTRASRRRLRERMVRFDWSEAIGAHRVLWITLTARRGSCEDFKVWLDNWWRRVVRRWPEFLGIWRLEFQRRGVPHIHLILYLPGSAARCGDVRRALLQWWLECSADGGSDWPGQCLRTVKSLAGLAAYLTDMGKGTQSDVRAVVNPTTGEVPSPGRWWGQRSAGPCLMGARGIPSPLLVYPVVVYDWPTYYEFRRFVRSLRTGRYRWCGAKETRAGPTRDSVEFFDTSGLFRVSGVFRDIGG